MKSSFLGKPILWILVLLTAALAIGTYFLRYSKQPEVSKLPLEEVKVEGQVVQVAPFITQLSAIGTLVASESVSIKPEIDGMIANIAFESGQQVQKGQLLYGLDDMLAKAQLNEAKAQLRLATLDYNRAKQLAEQKFVSNKELDKLFATFQVGEAQTEAAQAKLIKTQIKAPFGGIIGINQWSVGAYVRAGEELVSLVSIDPMRVDFRVGEEHLQGLQDGQKITINIDGFEEVFEGTITAIEPKIDPIGHSILVRALIDNPDKKLRPGLFANISLTLKVEEEAILIPESALETEGGEHFVYRVVDGVATKTLVTVGGYKEGQAYITEGLWRTDTIITAGAMKIGDGVPVQVIDPKAKFADIKQAGAKGNKKAQKKESSDHKSPENKSTASLLSSTAKEKALVPSKKKSAQSNASSVDYHSEYQSLLEDSGSDASPTETPVVQENVARNNETALDEVATPPISSSNDSKGEK